MRLLLPLAQACTHTFINTDVRRNDMPACEAAEALASSAKMLNRMGVGWKRGGERVRFHCERDQFLFFSWLDSQSKPSYRPSPLVAQVA